MTFVSTDRVGQEPESRMAPRDIRPFRLRYAV